MSTPRAGGEWRDASTEVPRPPRCSVKLKAFYKFESTAEVRGFLVMHAYLCVPSCACDAVVGPREIFTRCCKPVLPASDKSTGIRTECLCFGCAALSVLRS